MTGLTLEVVAVHRSPPTAGELIGLIESFLARRSSDAAEADPPRLVRFFALRPGSPRQRHDWPVAAIDSTAELAELLELSDGQLAWLADIRSLERTVAAERLRNYRYHLMARAAGLPRVIEAPKARLKEMQRWVLRAVLEQVPAHDAAHGFVRGRSAVTHAQVHTGQAVVIRLDLKDFFASIAAARVYGIFRGLGYKAPVAHALTGLCTNTIPLGVSEQIATAPSPSGIGPRFRLGRQLATPHLPQGAPTSPMLANLAAFRLDRRLAGLATSMQLHYSRYADDLTFSGRRRALTRTDQLQMLVGEIAADEGFALHREKTLVRTAAARQSVCGVVVNVHPNVPRAEYDRLKAVLHNAARHGPAAENRDGVADLEAHLRGRIAWVASLNPDRGRMLRRRFDEIDWNAGG